MFPNSAPTDFPVKEEKTMRRASPLLLAMVVTVGAVTVTIGTPEMSYKMPFCAD
jgi:hypothetical protein